MAINKNALPDTYWSSLPSHEGTKHEQTVDSLSGNREAHTRVPTYFAKTFSMTVSQYSKTVCLLKFSICDITQKRLENSKLIVYFVNFMGKIVGKIP